MSMLKSLKNNSLFVETPRKFITAKVISTYEDPGLRIESFAIAVINLRGVSTNKTIICFIAMQTYKELIIKKYYAVTLL